MSNSEFPEKFTEHGKEFNRISEADAARLQQADRQKFELVKRQRDTELAKIRADNERYREERIAKEKESLLRKPAPGMDGPKPVFGGRRVDQPEGVARENMTPEQLRDLHRTAEQNVRQAEQAHLERIERAFTQAQRDILDRALGPNRYPSRGR